MKLLPTGYASVELRGAAGELVKVFLKRADSLPLPKTNGFRGMLDDKTYNSTKAYWLDVHDKVKDPHSYFYAGDKQTPVPKPYPTLLAWAEAHVKYIDFLRALTLHTQAIANRLNEPQDKRKLIDIIPSMPVPVVLGVTRSGVGHLFYDVDVDCVGDQRKRTGIKKGDGLCKRLVAQNIDLKKQAHYMCYHCLGVARQMPLRHGLAI